MNILNFFKSTPTPSKRNKRFYGATTNNLFASWNASSSTADSLIKKDLKVLRSRTRDLCRNNPHAKKFMTMLKNNVIGSSGIKLQNKSKDNNGNYDKTANDLIESSFKEFSKKGNCDVTGVYSLIDIQKLIVSTVAQDGEILIRIVKNFPNKFGIALQVIEADHLDEQYNDVNQNINMSIEYDRWEKPSYYHIWKNNPNNYEQQSNNKRERVPASQILHIFTKDRISQSRGVTWFHAVMNDLKMYDGFAEAALVEKRLTASKMGFYKTPQGEEYIGDDADEIGNPVNEATPALFEVLPNGWDFESFDPKSGNDNFVDFGKAILRNIASGLGVSYNSLASDLEGVNYSSIRAGLIDERDHWKSLQAWLIEAFMIPFYEEWLSMQLLTQNIPLPLSKYEKFNQPLFISRGFAWVDPLKDVKANTEAINEGLKTATQVLSEQGLDIEEVYQELEKEKQLREKYGIMTASEIQNQGVTNATQTTV